MKTGSSIFQSLRVLMVFSLCCAVFVFISCSRDFSSGATDVDELSSEDQAWLMDDDGDGEPDSLQKYAGDCELSVEECLELSKKNKFNLIDSLSCELPVFSLEEGTYSSPQMLGIQAAGKGTEIRYTTDGTDPDSNSALFEDSIEIKSTVTIKARCYREGHYPSGINTAVFIFSGPVSAGEPVFQPSGGVYDSIFTVELSSKEASAVIRYTLDGSEPTNLSAGYTGPIEIERSLVLKARSYVPDLDSSGVAAVTYELIAAAPVSSMTPGSYDQAVRTALSTSTSKGVIRYTTDGSVPDASSPEYLDTIDVVSTTTIKAITLIEGWNPSPVAQFQYQIDISGSVSSPVFDPPAGNFFVTKNVSISTPTDGAEIRYTLDSSEPDSLAVIYDGPISIDNSTTLKARAYKAGLESSPVSAGVYSIQVHEPVFSPDSGDYNTAQTVSFTSKTPDAVIYYTLDGRVPDSASNKYEGDGILVNTSLTLKAVAVKTGLEPSLVTTRAYTITVEGVVSSPEFDPSGGVFTSYQSVNIISATEGSQIHYTTDGSVPDEESPVYLSPITVSRNMAVKAVASKQGLTTSPVSIASFSIKAAEAVFTPPGGTYLEAQTVSITSVTPDAKIYYTVDNSEPDSLSQLYSEAFTVDSTTTVKARVYREGISASSLSDATYNMPVKVKTPEFLPEDSLPTGPVYVSINCLTPGALIYYTLDGSAPASSSDIYFRPLQISENTVFSAIAVKSGMLASEKVTKDYSVKIFTPVFEPAPGSYSSAQAVEITCKTKGASIHYTTDGSKPTTDSPVYSGPVLINSTSELKAMADKKNMVSSETDGGTYTIESRKMLYLLSPNGGETLTANEVYTITWTSFGEIDSVSIAYTYDEYQGFITFSTPNDGSHKWLVPDVTTEKASVKIRDISGTVSDTSDVFFTIAPVDVVNGD